MSTTMTFLFTDIQGSSRLWETNEAAMRMALVEHDRLIEHAVEANHGHIFSHMGDGVAAAFHSATDALRCACDLQCGLLAGGHDEIGPLPVRIGVHSGEVKERDGDFFGPAVNRAARIMAAGHGGQIVVSVVTRRLAESQEYEFLDLGEHRLRDLGRSENIHQLLADGLPRDFPPLRTLSEKPNNLPVQLTSFVGREVEVDEVVRLLTESRLVTLTGVGGVGKTRVALQAAAEVAPSFLGGTWLVSLAPVSEPEGVDLAFLEALAVLQSDLDPRQAVIDHLSDVEALLVVDNCEHLIDASADMVADVLTAAPKTRVLATSRELLGIPGETAMGLRSMSLPEGERDAGSSEAVRLLVERSAQASPGFRSDGHEDAIVEICRRLDGIPLALELAAARLRTFSPERVAGLLDESFRLLTGGSRTAVPRQRTLEATIEWSHRLLGDDERDLFRKLAVFGGGFTVDSAQAVCTHDDVDEFTVMELLSMLVDKSLVATDEDVERFHLLETIRQFASARLEEAGDADAIRRKHAEHFREVVEDAAEERWGPSAPEVRGRIRAERANLRLAMTWALEAGEGELALDLALGFGRFRDTGRWSESLAWYERALEVADAPTDDIDRALRLQRLASFEAAGPDTDGAVERWEEAITIFERHDDGSDDDEWLLDYGLALLNLAVVRFYRGQGGDHNERFRAEVAQTLELARRIDHQPLIAYCLGNLAHHVDPNADPAEVLQLFEEAETATRRMGDPAGLASLTWQRARYEFYTGDLDASVRHWKSAIDHAGEGAVEDLVPRFRVELGVAELATGDESAVGRIEQAIREVLAASDTLAGSQAISQTMLIARASADAALDRHDRVAVAAGVSDAESGRDVPVPWDLVPQLQRLVAVSTAELGEDEFAARRAEGEAMSREAIATFLGEDV